MNSPPEKKRLTELHVRDDQGPAYIGYDLRTKELVYASESECRSKDIIFGDQRDIVHYDYYSSDDFNRIVSRGLKESDKPIKHTHLLIDAMRMLRDSLLNRNYQFTPTQEDVVRTQAVMYMVDAPIEEVGALLFDSSFSAWEQNDPRNEEIKRLIAENAKLKDDQKRKVKKAHEEVKNVRETVEQLEDEVRKLTIQLKGEEQKRIKAEKVVKDYLAGVFDNQVPTNDVGKYYDELKDREDLKKQKEDVSFKEKELTLQRLVDQAREERREQERTAERYFYQLQVNLLEVRNFFMEKLYGVSLEMHEMKSHVNERFFSIQEGILKQTAWFEKALLNVEKNQLLMESGFTQKLVAVQGLMGQFGVELQKQGLEMERGKLDLTRAVGKVEMLYGNFENNMVTQAKALDYALKKVAMQDEQLALKLSLGLAKMQDVMKDGKYALKEIGYTNALQEANFKVLSTNALHEMKNAKRDIKDSVRDAHDAKRDMQDVVKEYQFKQDWDRREVEVDVERAEQIFAMRQKDIQKEKEQLKRVRDEIKHQQELSEVKNRQHDSETNARSRIAEFNTKIWKKREDFFVRKIQDLEWSNSNLRANIQAHTEQFGR